MGIASHRARGSAAGIAGAGRHTAAGNEASPCAGCRSRGGLWGGIIALELLLFVPLDPDGIGVLQEHAGHTPMWQGLLASFYGGIAEELQLRLFLLSLLALGLRSVGRFARAHQRSTLPGWAFWGANVLAAVLFGLAHLPATAALIPITGIVVVRAVVLNGTVALVFGWLFRRNGIETAMAAHFAADLVLLVVAPLVLAGRRFADDGV